MCRNFSNAPWQVETSSYRVSSETSSAQYNTKSLSSIKTDHSERCSNVISFPLKYWCYYKFFPFKEKINFEWIVTFCTLWLFCLSILRPCRTNIPQYSIVLTLSLEHTTILDYRSALLSMMGRYNSFCCESGGHLYSGCLQSQSASALLQCYSVFQFSFTVIPCTGQWITVNWPKIIRARSSATGSGVWFTLSKMFQRWTGNALSQAVLLFVYGTFTPPVVVSVSICCFPSVHPGNSQPG